MSDALIDIGCKSIVLLTTFVALQLVWYKLVFRRYIANVIKLLLHLFIDLIT